LFYAWVNIPGYVALAYFLPYPIIDKIDNYIDQRVRVTEFKAEQTLTKDTVPVNVDAVVYWTVWDVEKAALEVQDYEVAIAYIAQTGIKGCNR
jgi:regulator of protease activity HflC (stomatin/prohibitin superfamily)